MNATVKHARIGLSINLRVLDLVKWKLKEGKAQWNISRYIVLGDHSRSATWWASGYYPDPAECHSRARVSHAYLFSGPRGTGKTSAAKILAKAVNCEHGPAEEPCNECEACRRITSGAVMDVQEIDAASNRGVEEIRDLREKVKYAPTEVRRKVYIIDEVHMLTTEAFNALLKTLEEPPAHVMFILATTEPHRLPATIISRCQRFDFRRVSLDEQTGRLEQICGEEGITAEHEARSISHVCRMAVCGMH